MAGLCLALAFSGYARGEIIDRIAVSVGNRVITASDLEREIRVTAFLNGVNPDLSPAGKRAAANRMVEQKLIRRELETSRYPIPEPSEIEPVLADFKANHFRDDADYRQSLAKYGITEQEVKDELLWQRTLLKFIDIRFRPGVQVSADEIQKYFDQNVAPTARIARPGQPVDLADYRDQIEEKLSGDKADEDMSRWLAEARKRTPVIFHDEVFK